MAAITSAVSPGAFKAPSTGIFGNDYVAELVKQGLSEEEVLKRVTARDIELTTDTGEIRHVALTGQRPLLTLPAVHALETRLFPHDALRLGRTPVGIRPEEQLRIAAGGARMRVYLPYGEEWYGYLMRRMAERPQNLGFFLRGLATKG